MTLDPLYPVHHKVLESKGDPKNRKSGKDDEQAAKPDLSQVMDNRKWKLIAVEAKQRLNFDLDSAKKFGFNLFQVGRLDREQLGLAGWFAVKYADADVYSKGTSAPAFLSSQRIAKF